MPLKPLKCCYPNISRVFSFLFRLQTQLPMNFTVAYHLNSFLFHVITISWFYVLKVYPAMYMIKVPALAMRKENISIPVGAQKQIWEVSMVKKNVGSVDKIVRIILGLVLLSLFFFLDGGIKYIGLLGIILLLTAFISFCPIYTIFRINTHSKE